MVKHLGFQISGIVRPISFSRMKAKSVKALQQSKAANMSVLWNLKNSSNKRDCDPSMDAGTRVSDVEVA